MVKKQSNAISINHFFKSFKTLDNKVVLKEIRVHLADLTT